VTRPRPSLAACAVLGLLLLGAWAAPAAGEVAPFTFVHASDPHFDTKEGPSSKADTNGQLYAEISALEPAPAFVVTTGDIAEHGPDAEYALFRKTVDQHLTIRHFEAPGNHDVRWNPRGKEGYTDGVGQPLHQSWDHNGVHFVTLDSTVLLQHWGHISQDQLDWLKSDLAKLAPDTPVVIGFHHWVGRTEGAQQIDNEQALLDVVAPHNVRLWLQGHGHSDIQWNVNGVPAIMQKGLYQGSYSVISVRPTEMKVRRRALGKPNRAGELVRDKSVTDGPESWSDVMTIPLARQVTPKWHAEATVRENRIFVDARRGDLPADAKLEYRIDQAKPEPMNGTGDAWTANTRALNLTAGEHVVTVLANLPDGRQYHQRASVTLTRPGAPEPAWAANVGGAVQSRLVRAGDALYVTSMGNDLAVLDPATGKESWRVPTDGSIFATPEVADGVVYFGSADHHIYAVDAATREVKWKHKTGGAVLAGLAVAQGVVCAASVDKTIYGLDAATGEQKWTAKGENMFQSKVATDGQRFFVGGWDNTFRCLDVTTGTEFWSHRFGKDAKSGKIMFYYAPAISSPAVDRDAQRVYVTSNDGVLHAVQTTTGNIAWEYDGKKLGYAGPLVRGGRVYVPIGEEGKVFCLDGKGGDLLWTADTGSVIYDSSPAFAAGHVFVGCVNGTFNAIEADTGKIAWQYRLPPGHLLASPAADERRVYIGNMSGNVLAFPAEVPGRTAAR